MTHILKSLKVPTKIYIGLTENVDQRLKQHNYSSSKYSKTYAPWTLETFIGFRNKNLASRFEKYLKSGSGHAFLKKRFLEPKE